MPLPGAQDQGDPPVVTAEEGEGSGVAPDLHILGPLWGDLRRVLHRRRPETWHYPGGGVVPR